MPLSTHTVEHEDLSTGGIFTPSELEAWRSHIELGDLHDALAKTITYGLCSSQGTCGTSPGIPQSNFRFQAPNIQQLTQVWNPLNKIHDFIQTTGGYIAAIVLVLEMARFASFAIAISMSLARDGLEGVKALAYALCCHHHTTATKLRRRHHRIRNRQKHESEDDETETIGLSERSTSA